MMFDVELSVDAQEFYANASPTTSNNVKRLKGEYHGIYRYRLGDWRVLFEIDHASRLVKVLTIAHRSEAYE